MSSLVYLHAGQQMACSLRFRRQPPPRRRRRTGRPTDLVTELGEQRCRTVRGGGSSSSWHSAARRRLRHQLGGGLATRGDANPRQVGCWSDDRQARKASHVHSVRAGVAVAGRPSAAGSGVMPSAPSVTAPRRHAHVTSHLNRHLNWQHRMWALGTGHRVSATRLAAIGRYHRGRPSLSRYRSVPRQMLSRESGSISSRAPTGRRAPPSPSYPLHHPSGSSPTHAAFPELPRFRDPFCSKPP